MTDITSILGERDEIRFKTLAVNATGTYIDEPEKATEKGKEWFHTLYENGEAILYEAEPLTDEERKLRDAWEEEERKIKQPTIAGSKKGPLSKRGPANKTQPFRK